MSRKTTWLIGTLVLAVLAGEWAGLRYFYGRSPLAQIECRASNAGASLAPEAVRVFVYPTGRPWELVAEGQLEQALSVVAEGQLEQALSVPPGRYDIRLLLDASADQQSEWFREIELAAGERVVKQVDFSAGELSIESPRPSDSEAPQLVVYVFAPENHDQIITSMRASSRGVA